MIWMICDMVHNIITYAAYIRIEYHVLYCKVSRFTVRIDRTTVYDCTVILVLYIKWRMRTYCCGVELHTNAAAQ